ncbi:MAG: hypothetical protein K9K86_07005, partial [Pseudomonadales bacterium]|nr:hypothetical protein [Pseudomonadales bacterium]
MTLRPDERSLQTLSKVCGDLKNNKCANAKKRQQRIFTSIMPNNQPTRSQFVLSLISFAFSCSVFAVTPESAATDNGRWRCQPNATGRGWQCDAIEPSSAQGILYVPVTT